MKKENTPPHTNYQKSKIKEQYLQFIAEYRRFTAIIIVIVVFLVWKLGHTTPTNFAWYSQWVDPLMAISTFMIAVFIWIVEIRKNWTQKLPKRLTVNYLYENRSLMRCEQVNISSESDIRSLGLSLGGQMAKSRLEIEPYYNETPAVEEWDDLEKTYFRHHQITFFLRAKPEKTIGASEAELLTFQRTQQIVEGGVMVWRRKPIA